MSRHLRRLPGPGLAVLLWGLMACAPEHSAPGVRFRVAVVPKGTVHEFWKSVEAGARAADAELADLEILWKGPAGEGDAGSQIALVESLLAGGIDGLCLAPLDARALETPVRQALAAKLPVVIFDSGLANKELGIASFVATDNYQGGRTAGDELARALGGQGQVLLLRYVLGSESTELREQGFLDAIAASPGIQVLSSDKHGGPDEGSAVAIAESLLATFGAELDGIFCSNEPTTSGMLTALGRDPRGLAQHIKLVGFDGGTKISAALASGALHATVLQDPVRMGYLAVKTMRQVLGGEPVEPLVDTGEVLATQHNLNDPQVRSLLYPGSGK